MAKAKPAKPPSKAKAGKGKPPARAKRGSSGGFPMFKLLFLAALVGAGYAAYTVPYHGHTMFDRAVYYVEHEMDEHHRAAQEESPTPAKKSPEAVADRRPTRTAPHAPAEHLTQSDKDALDKLLPH